MLDQLAGIGGHCDSFCPLDPVTFEGHKGGIVTTKTFIVRADIVLWGRTILSQ